MKKITATALIIIIIVALLNVRQILGIPVIGKVTGLENEKITIGDKVYEITHDSHVSRSDKGKYIGTVANGKIKMRIYETSDTNHIYALWEWEGAIYRRAR